MERLGSGGEYSGGWNVTFAAGLAPVLAIAIGP